MYVLATRIALGLLPEYTSQIEQFLSDKTQKSIAISSFTSRWDGLDPVLDVNGLSINGNERFYIRRLRFQFAFWPSVLSLRPKFEKILIEEAELTVKQQIEGRWFILFDEFGGEDFNTQASVNQPVIDYLQYLSLFNGTTLNLKDISATIYKHNGSKRKLRLPNLNVNYKEEQIFASGQILESRGEKALLNFSLNGRGLFSKDPIKGTLYVEARSSEFFGELLSIYNWKNVSIQNIEASSRVWINFEDMKIDSIYGDVQVSELNWKMTEKSLPPVHDLAFSYFAQIREDAFMLSMDDFGFEWAELHCDPGDIRLERQGSELFVQAEKLKLQCLNRLVLSLDLAPEKLAARLYQSNPEGYLNNVHLSVSSPEENGALNQSVLSSQEQHQPVPDSTNLDAEQQKTTFTFEALLENVSLSAYESTPSGRNLSGYLFADNDSGYVSFLSEDFELGFPKLFLEPWGVKLAEGRVNWLLHDHDVSINSEGLRLWRDDESLIYGDFMLRLNPADQEDYLALSIGMQDIQFTDAVKFVPFHSVDHGLYEWLSESLIKGVVSNGVYYGYGSVEDSTQENDFTSSLYLVTDKGELKFDPDWPSLAQLDAELFLQNGQLAIAGKRGTIANTSVENIDAFLPEGKAGKGNAISISAQAKASNEDIHYWLSESPIANATQTIADQLLIDGSATTNISLNIPVAQADEPEKQIELGYRVEVMLDRTNIDHPASRLSFTDVKGLLVVDSEKGISADNMRLKTFDKPARLDIKTEYLKRKVSANLIETETITRLLLNGKLSSEDIFHYLQFDQPDALSGAINYAAQLTLSDQEKQYPMLRIESDLLGLRCDCPAPFAKSVDQREQFDLSLLLKPEQSYLEANLLSKHLPKIKTELLLVADKPIFGEVLIGGARVTNTQIKGLNVAARLQKLNLERWIDFLSSNFLAEAEAQDIPLKVLVERPVPKENGFLKQVQLEIEDLNAFDYTLQKTVANLSPDDTGRWQIKLSGPDVSGQVSLANNSDPLTLNLDALNLRPLKPDMVKQAKSGRVPQKKVIDPRNFPRINFQARNLFMEQRPLGSWQFNLQPHDDGSAFRDLKGHFKSTNISGLINWRVEGDAQRSSAILDVKGKDVASVFALLDLPVLINSERFSSDVALVWPAAPYDFSLASLSGKISLNLEDGFIKTEDEKTGALRLFGVLNAESIKRRLKLDFSDLYKSGVGYDSFSGQASLDNGLLTLREPLKIEGPAGKYQINGRSDLATKALDFDMLVELPFSQNFPLAALVLGAPQVGGLVWVADKLLGEPLSALTTSRYDITGTWEEPRVDLHQAVNASKKDRSKEKGMRDGRN